MRPTTSSVFGMTLALLGAGHAIADDTELLLVAPAERSQTRPNVMFILDTSGSMKTVQETDAPYAHTSDYSAFGSCDPNSLYYVEDGSIPVCDGSNTRYIARDAWNCEASASQIADAGAYSGVLAQYRPNLSASDLAVDALGSKQWQALAPGNSSDAVECEADDGKHGSVSSNSATDVHATNGPDADGDGWTSDPTESVAWGGSGVNMTYTIYDGNYLNYRNDPTTRLATRSDIMKEVTKRVLNSVNGMNVGLMRFNKSAGGVVIQAPVDLDANREMILARIDSVDADGWTPLSESLFESALLWHGLPAHFGELHQEYATDPAALVSSTPEIYARPDMSSCSRNFNVLITDGAPTKDTDTFGLLGQLPDYAMVTGRTGCSGTGEGACLADIAEYLSRADLHPTLRGRQSVITHTIGFTVDLPILEETARVAGGQYLLAEDADSLLRALSSIVAQVNERALSFSAPAVPVNTFNRTRNLNDLYITMFGARSAAHWPGNLKRYKFSSGKIVDAQGNGAIDPDTGFFYDSARSIWTTGQADGNDVLRGGAAHRIPDPSVRRLFTDNGFDTNLSGNTNALSPANARAFTAADFGLSINSSVTVSRLIRWMRGEDIKDDDGDPTTTIRYAMGDPLHSRPAAITYGGTAENPEAVVYVGTNDGYLHAFDARNGVELWSYVPKDLLPRMALLFDDPEIKYKLYGIDGDILPVLHDVDRDGQIEPRDGDRALILFGLRRGGSKYRMIDVTDRDHPKLLWERVLQNGGESWSTAAVTRIAVAGKTQNEFSAVAVFGGGYDRVHDTPSYNSSTDVVGAGLHILDLLTGEPLWRAGHPSTRADLSLGKMTKAIPTRIKVIDINGDGFADRMYAADLGGQVWRFDITNGKPAASLVTGGVIARLGPEGLPSPTAADTRRFYNSPDIAVFEDLQENRRHVAINIGSGYRAHPLDLSATDRFYSIRDPFVFSALTQAQYDDFHPLVEANLVEVSGQVNTTIASGDAGWMLTLPENQMVLAESFTFADEVFFVGFSPDSEGVTACSAGVGKNYLYRVSVVNGDPIADNLSAIPTGREDAARMTQLAQVGIAPAPSFVFPGQDDPDCTGPGCSPPPLACIGLECFDPGFPSNPIRTLWTQHGVD